MASPPPASPGRSSTSGWRPASTCCPRCDRIYRWQGAVQEDTEQQVVIKTTRARMRALRDRLHMLHPYQVPEFIVISVADATEAYGGWLLESTS